MMSSITASHRADLQDVCILCKTQKTYSPCRGVQRCKKWSSLRWKRTTRLFISNLHPSSGRDLRKMTKKIPTNTITCLFVAAHLHLPCFMYPAHEISCIRNKDHKSTARVPYLNNNVTTEVQCWRRFWFSAFSFCSIYFTDDFKMHMMRLRHTDADHSYKQN